MNIPALETCIRDPQASNTAGAACISVPEVDSAENADASRIGRIKETAGIVGDLRLGNDEDKIRIS